MHKGKVLLRVRTYCTTKVTTFTVKKINFFSFFNFKTQKNVVLTLNYMKLWWNIMLATEPREIYNHIILTTTLLILTWI